MRCWTATCILVYDAIFKIYFDVYFDDLIYRLLKIVFFLLENRDFAIASKRAAKLRSMYCAFDVFKSSIRMYILYIYQLGSQAICVLADLQRQYGT